jgi:lysophospholipase L1-like esterase
MKAKKLIIAAAGLITALAAVRMYLIGARFGKGSLGFLKNRELLRAPGNAKQYHLNQVNALKASPLYSKHLCFLGSSVTAGDASLAVSFADYLSKRNSCTYVKEALGGTTLVDNGPDSYIQRMISRIDKNELFDCFICQLSTNDASKGFDLGHISTTKDRNSFHTNTILGAIEYIIAYAKQTWDCPVVFYTGTKFDSVNYEAMVEALLQLQKKWDIGVIDLWHDEEMNGVSKTDYNLYMFDQVHPTQAGYLKWWTPVMEKYLYEFLN